VIAVQPVVGGQGVPSAQTASVQPGVFAHLPMMGASHCALPPLQAHTGTWPHGGWLGGHASEAGAQWWKNVLMQSAQPPVGSHVGQQLSS
jgi:hypothetical protein